MATHDPDALARHFDLVRLTTNEELRQLLARFFVWHGLAAAAAARELDASSEVVRERAVMVLGWGVGGAKDVAALSKILASDDASAARAMAASQLVFFAEGSNTAKARAVAELAAVLCRDGAALDDRVRDAVVDAAESLTKQRFGPKSDRAARAERGRRALAALATRPSR